MASKTVRPSKGDGISDQTIGELEITKKEHERLCKKTFDFLDSNKSIPEEVRPYLSL
jgi:hypothetical protein